MESQPQNPGFRINPENFHPCVMRNTTSLSRLHYLPNQLVLDNSW